MTLPWPQCEPQSQHSLNLSPVHLDGGLRRPRHGPPAPPHAPQNGVTCPGRQQPSSWPATSGPDSGPLGPARLHSRTACTNTGASLSAPTAPSGLVTPGEAQQGTRSAPTHGTSLLTATCRAVGICFGTISGYPSSQVLFWGTKRTIPIHVGTSSTTVRSLA